MVWWSVDDHQRVDLHYDGFNRLREKVTTRFGETRDHVRHETYSYEDGQVIRISRGSPAEIYRETIYRYDRSGRLVMHRDGDDSPVRFVYDRNGWLARALAPSDQSKAYEYRTNGRVQTEKVFEGRQLVETKQFDLSGKQLVETSSSD